MSYVNPVIRRMNPSSLTPAQWNPPMRITESALAGLLASMRKYGFWPYRPIIVGRDETTVADGHRRLAAALILQIPQVPCFVVDKDPGLLWAELNDATRSLTLRDSFDAYRRGLEHLPESHRADIERLIDVVDDARTNPAFENVSPAILGTAMRVCTYLGQSDREMQRTVTFWLVRHGQMRVKRAIKDGIGIDVLLACIVGDRSVPTPRYE